MKGRSKLKVYHFDYGQARPPSHATNLEHDQEQFRSD